MQRRTFLLTTAAVGAAAFGTVAGGVPAFADPKRTVEVSSLATLQAAINAAKPGAVIVLANGTYDVPGGEPLLIAGRNGSDDNPIVIRAATVGGVTLTGPHSFVFSHSRNVVLEGFVFTQSSTLEVPSDCRKIVFSRNDIRLADVEGLHCMMIRGDDCVVERNHFHAKSTLGVFLGIEGAGTAAMAQGVRVVRNYFSDHSFAGANGGEPIRLGVSPRALSSAFAVVEENLFERTNGDPEAISLKSSDNTIRHNTFRNSSGGIVLRHGNRNRVEGNSLLNGGDGIRIYGNDHLVANNYLSGLKWGIRIGAGNVKDHFDGESASSRRGNDAADRVRIVLNTLVANGGGIEGETARPIAPTDCVISDNIIVGDAGVLASARKQSGFSWSGNILWGAAPVDASVPAAGYRVVDPQLLESSDGVSRLGAGSPAIGAATLTYADITEDLDGDLRHGSVDVGADQYSTAAPRFRPLSPADVGPFSA